MNKTKFSIVVPIYNVSRFLECTINSVINQSYDNLELILVDDGSTDDCPEICDTYAKQDQRITVIHKKNGGLVSARKEGVKVARGDYTLCLDGDDWIKEDALNKISKTVDDNQEPDIVCFGITRTNGNSNVQPVVRYRRRCGYYNKNDIIDEIYPMLIQKDDATYFPPSLCGKAIKTVLYKEQQMKVPNSIIIGEDGACTIPCIYRANSLYIMKEYLYFYRQNASSMTRKKKVLSWAIPIVNSEHIRDNIDINEYDFKEQLYRKICHDTFYVIVASFYNDEKYNVIKQIIKKNLSHPVIDEAIKKARFKNSKKAVAYSLLLKYGIYFPFYVYSIIR